VVIVGGAGLIGAEFCQSVHAAGYRVVIADANSEKASAICRQLDESGETVSAFQLNATNPASIKELLQHTLGIFGRADALVNTLYIRSGNYGADFFEVTYADFCTNLSDNVGSMFECSKVFAQYFTENGGGNIINTSSVYGCIAPRFEIYNDTPMNMPVEYAGIKSAIIHLTRYMAKRFKGLNIRANCICPGGILDGQPQSFCDAYGELSINKGMLNKEDLSGTLLFLLSDDSRFINGQNIVVDDGFTL